MLKHLLVFLGCLFFSGVFAQNTSGTQTLYQYTTENGLPSNLIRGIQWDNKTGFLWIITEGGLVRYNGIEFRSYNKEKISPLAPEKQVFAVKNNTGNIFISDGSGSIFEIIKNKPVLSKSLQPDHSFINYYFISVSETFFNNKVKGRPAFPGTFENIISLSDTACLVLYQNMLYRFGINSQIPAALFNNISALFQINGNTFIIDNNKKAFLLNENTFSRSPVDFSPSNQNLQGILAGTSRLFWINGIQRPLIIRDNVAWQLYFQDGKISEKQITSLVPTDANISTVQYVEETGLLFIGTDSKGLIVISQNKVFPKKRKNANPKNKNAYFSQIALDNGNILTNEGDIIGDNNSPAVLPAKGKFSNRTSITNNGKLIWYNSTESKSGIYCLHQFNKETGNITVFTKIKPLTQVAVTNNKTCLANNEGIGFLEGDSMHYLYHYKAGSVNIKTYDFKELSPGVLIIAGCQGLLKFTLSGNKLDTIFARPNACFGSIWKYKDYLFWGSYGYGYYIYKNGRIKEMPLDKNEYLLYSHCFVEDAEGYCWISTNRGLFKANLNDIITNFETGANAVYYHFFGRRDGIEMTELNGGCTPCALVLSDYTISFPSMDGLLWANPKTAVPIVPSGELYIDEILVDNSVIDADLLRLKHLSALKHDIRVEVGFPAWGNKENIYIQYRLNNEGNWKSLNIETGAIIQLSNLAKGDYAVQIRKLNGFGTDNYSYKEIRFSISAPWYERWWFIVLSAMALAGLIFLFFRIRTNQYKTRQRKLEAQVTEKTKELKAQNEVLEKNNSIKTRLISIISHDIVTPLKFLTAAGKNLQEKRKMMPEELQHETLAEITNTSQELQLLSTNILNWIKYQNENRRMMRERFGLYEMVEQVLSILNSLAKQKKLVIVNRVDPSVTIYQFYEPLKILLYNLLTNAIRFTEKGSISVEFSQHEDKSVLSVKDEGIGMTPEQIQRITADEVVITAASVDNKKGHGLGYLIIKDLLKMIVGKLEIDSSKGKGTTVSITMQK
jgi:signal transduction histidine kinase